MTNTQGRRTFFGFALFLASVFLMAANFLAEDWIAVHDGNAPGVDYVADNAVDDLGNVYVAGYSLNEDNRDWLLVKLNSNGIRQWHSSLELGSFSGAEAQHMEVSSDGSIYVCGGAHGSGEFFRTSLLVKYNSLGQEEWRDSSGYGFCHAIKQDSSGGVYILRGSEPNDSSTRFLVEKFNSDGVEQWSEVFEISPADETRATDLAIDDFGNAYVSGWTYESEGDRDYLTVKYSNLGVLQWSQVFDGGNGDDVGNAIGVDALGNVYTLGTSKEEIYPFSNSLTVMYNSSGIEQWNKRLDGGIVPGEGTHLIVEGTNIYIAGRCGYQVNYCTAKLTDSGAQLWREEYNFSLTSYDQLNDLALDSNGNVIVTGTREPDSFHYELHTIKYDSSGNLLWANTYEDAQAVRETGVAIAIDSADNIFISGTTVGSETVEDFTTIKYEPSGTLQWLSRHEGPGDIKDDPKAVAYDSQGNVFVGGESGSFESGKEITVIKYGPLGNELWVSRYGDPAYQHEFSAMEVDAAGNIYVLGQLQPGDDIVTLKYDTAGNLLWANIYNGLADGIDRPEAMTIDGSSNVFVTGVVDNAAPPIDEQVVVLKYSALGSLVWESFYTPEDSVDISSIAVDTNGEIIVFGNEGFLFGSPDLLLLKFDNLGNELWTQSYDSGSSDRSTDMVLDNSGNIFLLGQTGLQQQDLDYVTIKYSSSGEFLWNEVFDGLSTDIPRAMAIDKLGDIYVTGLSSSETGLDFLTIKYGSDGSQKWITQTSGGIPTAMALDELGNAYVTGQSSDDFITLKYNGRGDVTWAMPYSGNAGASDLASAIAADASGNIVVTGSVRNIDSYFDFATINYALAEASFDISVFPEPVAPGSFVSISVSGAQAFTSTYLAYSLDGYGSTPVAPLNLSLNVDSPKQLDEPELTDFFGNASWVFQVPQAAAGQRVLLQAAQQGQKSNVAVVNVLEQ